MPTAHDHVVSLLSQGRRRLVRRTAFAGLWRTAAVAASAVAIALLVILPHPPAAVAAAASVLAVLATLFAAGRYLLLPLLRLPSLEGYAVRVDEVLGEGRNLAINALELGRRQAAEKDAFTRALIGAHVDETAREIDAADLSPIGRPGRMLPWRGALAGSVALLALLSLFAPGAMQRSAFRLFHPRLSEPMGPMGLAVQPGDIDVDSGSDVFVRAVLTGSRETPRLRFAPAGTDWNEAEMTAAPAETAGRVFGYTFQHLERDMNYQVSVGNHASDTWKIHVTEPPRALGYRLTYEYPRYTGLPSETRVAGTGDVTALLGTHVTLEIEVNDPQSGGYLALGDERVDLKRGTDSMSRLASLTVRGPQRYRVHLTDRKGRDRFASPEFAIEPVPDRPPALTVVSPARNVDVPENMSLPLAATAVDDYGLTQMLLHSQVGDAPEQRRVLSKLSGREANVASDWDLSSLDLVPGEVVSYYFEVFDNDTVSGPKSTRSDTYTIRFPTMDEMYSDLNEQRDDEVHGLEQIREDQQHLKQQLEDAARQLKKGLEMNWDKQKEISNMANEQQKLQDRMSEVQKSLEQSIDQIEKNDLMGLEMVEKLDQIRDLMNQIQNEDVKAALQKLQQAIEKMNRSDVQKALEQMNMTQQDLLKSLDRTIEMLKRLQQEEKLAELIEKTADMLQRQEKINEDVEQTPQNKPMDSLEQRQEDVSKDLEKSADQLQQLQKESQSSFPQMSQSLQKSVEQQNIDQTQQSMQQAQQSMSQMNKSQAGKHGQKARTGLQSLLSQLQQSQASMSQQMTAQMSEKLTRIQNDLLDVSKSQEEVLQSPAETSTEDLAERQEDLESAAKRAADGLFQMSKETQFITPQLGQMIGSAIDQLSHAKESFARGDKPGGMQTGKQSQVSVNQTILALMQQNKSMCQNPGSSGNPMMSQMQSLGQQQQQLNSDSQSMAQQLRERLQQSGQDQLTQLAARQEMIKKGLEEVQGQLGERSDVLGRLDQMSQEMGDIAQKMREEGLPDAVLQRQQKILSRLLDAQKSVRKEDYSRRRRSETGVDVNRASPAALPPGLLTGPERLQSDILRGAADPYPSEYRRLVEQYFRALTSGTTK